MKRYFVFSALVIPGLLTLNCAAQGTAFTYQGRLSDSGNPSNGSYDFRFLVFDLPSGGLAIAPPITNANVSVTGGLFTATLDFGANVFDGGPRWLGIGVRTNGGAAFTPVLPRQPIDADGVALAAIQGLNQKLEERDARISTLENELIEVKRLLTHLARKRN